MPRGHSDKSLYCPICGRRMLPFKGIRYDPISRVVIRAGYERFVVLAPTEALLFVRLMKSPGLVVARDILWNAAFGHRKECEQPDTLGALDAQLHSMRVKLKTLNVGVIGIRDFGSKIMDLAKATERDVFGHREKSHGHTKGKRSYSPFV